jgi:hypothetical protein
MGLTEEEEASLDRMLLQFFRRQETSLSFCGVESALHLARLISVYESKTNQKKRFTPTDELELPCVCLRNTTRLEDLGRHLPRRSSHNIATRFRTRTHPLLHAPS